MPKGSENTRLGSFCGDERVCVLCKQNGWCVVWKKDMCSIGPWTSFRILYWWSNPQLGIDGVGIEYSLELLQVYCREHIDWLHYSQVWQLECPGMKEILKVVNTTQSITGMTSAPSKGSTDVAASKRWPASSDTWLHSHLTSAIGSEAASSKWPPQCILNTTNTN